LYGALYIKDWKRKRRKEAEERKGVTENTKTYLAFVPSSFQ
jgi:hypothetical protein